MTVRLTLDTVAIRPDGCFSVALWDGRPFCVSVERTFDDVRPVIGAGVFHCRLDYYHKGNYPTFEIQVAGHDRVLFHKGNLEIHSRACVILGETFGGYNPVTGVYSLRAGPGDVTAVLSSGDAFGEFMANTGELKEFDMEVLHR